MGTRHYFEKKGTREIRRFTSQLTLKSVPHIYTFRLMDVFLFWGWEVLVFLAIVLKSSESFGKTWHWEQSL